MLYALLKVPGSRHASLASPSAYQGYLSTRHESGGNVQRGTGMTTLPHNGVALDLTSLARCSPTLVLSIDDLMVCGMKFVD